MTPRQKAMKDLEEHIAKAGVGCQESIDVLRGVVSGVAMSGSPEELVRFARLVLKMGHEKERRSHFELN